MLLILAVIGGIALVTWFPDFFQLVAASLIGVGVLLVIVFFFALLAV